MMDVSSPTKITGILDWQGACIRPGLEHFKIPDFFSVDDDDLRFIVIDRQGGLGDQIWCAESIDPDNMEEQDQLIMEHERDRAYALLRYARVIRAGSRSDTLGDTFLSPSPLLKALRRLIGFTPRSYEEGLIKLRSCIKDTISKHFDLPENGPMPTLPSHLFADDPRAIVAADLPDRIAGHIAGHIETFGISTNAEGHVDERHFELTCKEMEVLRSDLLSSLDPDLGVVSLEDVWPFQDGRWSTSAEICK